MSGTWVGWFVRCEHLTVLEDRIKEPGLVRTRNLMHITRVRLTMHGMYMRNIETHPGVRSQDAPCLFRAARRAHWLLVQ